MKKVMIFFLLLTSNKLIGQVTNLLTRDSSDIYVYSFASFCKHIKENYPKVKTVYLRGTTFYSSLLPSSSYGLLIKRMSDEELKRATKGNKAIYITEVLPLQTKNGIFHVNIIPFKVARVANKFEYINRGGLIYNYKFNAGKDAFEALKTTGGFQEIE